MTGTRTTYLRTPDRGDLGAAPATFFTPSTEDQGSLSAATCREGARAGARQVRAPRLASLPDREADGA